MEKRKEKKGTLTIFQPTLGQLRMPDDEEEEGFLGQLSKPKEEKEGWLKPRA